MGLLTKCPQARPNYAIMKEQGGEGMQLKYHMVTIEELVPAGDFLRKLEATLDFVVCIRGNVSDVQPEIRAAAD